MKILHVIPSLNPAHGGTVECLLRISSAHVAGGVLSEIVCFDEPEADYGNAAGIPVHRIGRGISKYQYHSGFVPWLRGHVGNYDSVIVHGIWTYHSFGVWRVLHKLATPYFVYPHGMLDPWFKKQYPLKHLKKWLFWPWSDYRVLRDAKAVLFTCEEEKVQARKSFWLFRVNDVVVNFGAASADADPENLRSVFFSAFPELLGKNIVLFLGRVHPKKGCDLLVRAFFKGVKEDQNMHLVFAGPCDSVWADELKQEIGKLGIADKVSWLGLLKGDLKWGCFYAANVFALPSHQENFGMSVAESLSCGLPVLISDKVNIWREIQMDGCGLVGKDDYEGTLDCIRRWLALPFPSKEEMRVQARKTYHARFTVEQMASSLLRVVQDHR